MLRGASNEPNQMKEKYLNTPSAGQHAIPMAEKTAPAGNPFKDPENPFADPIRSAPQPPAPAPAPIAMPEPVTAHTLVTMPTPMQAPALVSAPVSPVSDSISEKIAAAAASAGAVAAARAVTHTEPRQSPQPVSVQPEPIEMPSPPVGVPAPLVMHKANSSIASSAASAPQPEGSVYRILMDFAPSMDDELELRAGQVVRMLHEYDDGWVSFLKSVLFPLANK